MKTFKVKNYKGNLVESLSKFQETYKDMKIIEAVEEDNALKIIVNEAVSYVGGEHARYTESPTLDQLITILTKFKKVYPELSDKKIYAIIERYDGKDGAEPYVFDDNGNESSFGIRFLKFK